MFSSNQIIENISKEHPYTLPVIMLWMHIFIRRQIFLHAFLDTYLK